MGKCGPVYATPSSGPESIKDIDGNRMEMLQRGVSAVVNAMASEVEFTNDNEKALRMFRLGCRHCERMPSILDDIGPKDTIVAFLARVAARRAAAQQVRELFSILVKAATWCEALNCAPEPLRDVLERNSAIQSAIKASQSVVANLEPPTHGARVFLRERNSKQYLTVAALKSGAPGSCIIMTELPASLFIAYHAEKDDCNTYANEAFWADDAFTSTCSEDWEAESEQGCSSPKAGQGDPEEPAACILGFEHEGIPNFRHFLGCQRSWRQASLHKALTGAVELEVRCTNRRLGRRERFEWHADASLRHVSSGRWLHVDPASTEEIRIHTMKRSTWEALIAT